MRVKFNDVECFRDYVMEYDYESDKFTVWKPVSITDIKKEAPKPVNPGMVDKDTDNYADYFGLRTFKNLADDVEQIDFSMLDEDDGLLPTVETKSPALSNELDKYKSHNVTLGTFNQNQTHGLSAEAAGLDKIQASYKVLNKSTEEALLDMVSIFDSNSEDMSNNETDSIISHVSVVERKVRSLPTTDTSITSSDAPNGERNISMEDENASLNSSALKPLLSNQTLVNKTVIQEELNAKNSTDVADGERDSSGQVFIYNVPSPDSLSNISETQVEEKFVLLDIDYPLEISTDLTTRLEYDVSLLDTLEDTGELTENTTRILELNSTKGNNTSEMFSQINSETDSIFYLNSSSPLRNSTSQSNESESSNETLSDFSLHLEPEITENITSSTNDSMQSHSEISRNASQFFPLDSKENTSFSLGPFNVSPKKNGSESKGEEEVVIYLKNNHSEAILTSHIDPKEEHWSYEGKHELVHMEIPDHMKKYMTDTANSSKPKSEKKKKIVHQRVKPRKGHGMKTKKRKDYKPQPRSAFSPRGLSPRGFGPSVLSPRGTKPVLSEDDLMGKAIVIGVPRRDFNDYDLYVPKQGQETDFDGMFDPPEEYEYVEYKDPYSKTADVQNPVLDTTSQHFLKMAGDKNTRTYFISVEEEEWDYAGYGQRYCRHHAFQIIIHFAFLEIKIKSVINFVKLLCFMFPKEA